MNLRQLLFIRTAAGGGADDGNFVTLASFEDVTGLTVSNGVISGTAKSLNGNAREYALKKTIPAGTKIKATVKCYTDADQGESGYGFAMRANATDDTFTQLILVKNNVTTETEVTDTVTLEKDVDSLKFGYYDNYNNVWHLKDLSVVITE